MCHSLLRDVVLGCLGSGLVAQCPVAPSTGIDGCHLLVLEAGPVLVSSTEKPFAAAGLNTVVRPFVKVQCDVLSVCVHNLGLNRFKSVF